MIIRMTFKAILTLSAFIFVFTTCTKRPNTTQTPVSWLSDDPLTIPYRLRQQKLEKGNLVWNSSFESGRNLIIDSTGVTYRLDGWQKIGEHVYWVNINADSVFSADEAIDSLRAIKIHRNYANETDDPGEGVLSDYIRVIPGNYQLTFKIRLENIRPNRSRLGTRIYDAVNIRLTFYDKNKIEISSKKYDPSKNILIDNSFKSYSFSNYFAIPSLAWCKVIGKSVNDPLIDGDTPDEARFVKIFLGLKGTGTMWIDQVDYRYTERNFTTLERMTKLLDTTFLKHEMIIPQPKSVIKYESLTYFNSEDPDAKPPIIVIPAHASKETLEAARLIRSTIEELNNTITEQGEKNIKVTIVDEIPYDIPQTARIVFSIGKNSLYQRFREILPYNEIEKIGEGYFIASASDLGNIIFLCGSKPIGDFYAAATAIQLFDKKKYIFHNARVIDYPDYPERYISLGQWKNQNDVSKGLAEAFQLAGYKINGGNLFLDCCGQKTEGAHLYNLSRARYLGTTIFKYDLLLAGFNLSAYSNTGSIDLKSGCSVLEYKNTIPLLMGADFENLIIGYYPPIPSVLENLEVSDIAEYADVVNYTDHLMHLREKGDVYIIPFWFDNESMNASDGKAGVFIKDLKRQINGDIKYYWRGSSSSSYYTDDAEIRRIGGLMQNNPVWWDNSLSSSVKKSYSAYYAGEISMFNLFEPYNNQSPEFIKDQIDTVRIYANFITASELDLIRAATFADYAWNNKKYEPDVALWKILCQRYGNECAKELIYLNDYFAAMLRLTTELKNPAHFNRLVRNAEDNYRLLLAQNDKIKGLLGAGHPLVKELSGMITDLGDQYKNLVDQYMELSGQTGTE